MLELTLKSTRVAGGGSSEADPPFIIMVDPALRALIHPTCLGKQSLFDI
jgi:hypothetical protein